MKHLAVAPLSDGRLELWARTDQGQLLTTWKATTNPDAIWADWSDFLSEVGPLPGGVTSLAVAPLPDGRLELWVSTDQGKLLTTWKTATNPDADWAGWNDFLTEVGPLTGSVTDVAVASLPDGRLELWVSTDQGELFTTWKTTTDPDATWVGWSDFLGEVGPLTGAATAVAVAPLSDGRLELWVSTDQGKLLTTWKTTTNPDATWVGWSDFLGEVGALPGAVTDVAVASLPDGRLELWARTDQGQLFTTWKTAVDPDATWSSWSDFLAELGQFSSPVTDVAVAPLSNGRLQLWMRTDQGVVLTTWKSSVDPDATWVAWSAFVTGEPGLGLAITEPILPPSEHCPQATDATDFFDVPSELRDCQDVNCGRLIPNLRRLAQTKDASGILVDAAFVYYMLRRPEVGDLYPLTPSLLFAQAAADLAVTGQEAYSSFRQLALRAADLIEPVRQRIQQDFPDHEPVPIDVAEAVEEALTRAYSVAWALRGPAQHRKTERPALGWIAVSGEDDPPHRPVNVPSALYPQYNVTVQVNTIPVVARYVVVSRHVTDEYPVDLDAIPPDRSLPLIVGDIILFIHGHSSSLEEALPLVRPLLKQAGDKGRPVTLIAMDLPSNGYSSMVEHKTAGSEDPLWNTGYPILDFIENFIVAFVDQLEVMQPGIQKQIVGVIGGSLGGNMTLRLGRRDPAIYPWLHSVVSWSPASSWVSWARAVIGVPIPTGRFYDLVKFQGVAKTRGQMVEAESTGSLHVFFYEEIAGQNVGRIGQAEHWYSNTWKCREAAKTGSHRSVYEIYNETFRQWHWRVAHEQLIFSHWDSDNMNLAVDPDPRINPTAGPARYSQIKSRLLLATGAHDNLYPENIYDFTRALANAMTMVRGTTLFLKNTGHSIPTERPVFFAGKVLDFLFVTPPTPSVQRALWIREVAYNPPGADINLERVVIQNDTAAPISMSNWTLRDAATHVFTFPGFVLEAGFSVTVWTKAGANDAANLFWGHGAAIWNNAGDTATLRDQNGTEVARYAYRDS